MATITLGLAALFAAIGITDGLVDAEGAVVGALVIFGLTRLVISWYPMDEPGAERTSHGQAHGLVAVITFGVVTIAAPCLGSLPARTEPWRAELRPIQASGWVLLAIVLLMAVVGRAATGRRFLRAVERCFCLGMFAFVGLSGVALV